MCAIKVAAIRIAMCFHLLEVDLREAQLGVCMGLKATDTIVGHAL